MAKSNRQLLITLGADTTTFSQKVKRAKDLTKELDSNFKLLSSSSRDFDKTLDGLGKKQDYLNDKIKVATTLNDAYNERLADQQDRLNRSTESMKKLEKELKDLKDVQQRSLDPQEWSDWQKEIEKVEDELAQVRKETKNFQDAVISVNTAINKNQTEIQKMNGELAETKVKFDMLSRDNVFEKMHKDIEETDRRFENIKSSTDGFGRAVSDLKAEKMHLNTQIQKTNKLMQEYENDIEKSTSEMTRMQMVVESLTREYNEMKTAVDKMDGTEKHYEKWANDLNKVGNELTSANRLLNIHSDRVDELKTSYKQSENNLKSMEGSVKRVNNELKDFGRQQNFKSLEQSLEKLNHEFELSSSKIELLKSKYNNFENSLSGTVKQNKLLADQTEKLNEQFGQQQSAITQYSNKIKELEKEQTRLKNSLKETGNALETMDKNTPNFSDTLVTMGNMERELQDVENEIEDVTNKLRQMELSANSTLTQINTNIREQGKTWDVIGTKMQNLGSAMQSIGGTLMPITAGVTALGTGITITGANFQQSMSKVQALSGATAEEFKKLEQTARDLGKSTVFSATQASEGLQFLALAGYSVEDSMSALPIILDSAVAGAMELGTASDLATDVLSSLGDNAEFSGDKIKDLDLLMNQVAKTSTKSNTSMEQLLQAYIKVGGQVENMNIPLSTANTMLSILADRGIKAEEAGNSLNSILINLTKTGGESAKAMKELGVSAFDAKGNIKPIEQLLGELKKKLSGLSEQKQIQLVNMIGGKTQAKTLQKLLQGIDADTKNFTEHYKGLRDEIEKSVDTGALQNLRKTMEDNLTTDWKTLGSALEESFLKVFEDLEPKLREIVQSLTEVINELSENDAFVNVFENFLDVIQKLIDKFSNLSPSMQETIIKFTLWSGILAPIISVLGSVVSGIGSLVKVFGNLPEKVKNVKNLFKDLKNSGVTLGGFFTDFKGTVSKLGTFLGGSFTATLSSIATWLLPLLAGALVIVSQKIGDNREKLAELQDSWGGFGKFVALALEGVNGTIDLFFGKIKVFAENLPRLMNSFKFGGETPAEVWEQISGEMELSTKRAMSNMNGEMTKAIGNIRKMTQKEFTQLSNSFSTVWTEWENATKDGGARLSERLATQVQNMDTKMIETLRGTSDTMALLFADITENMSVEQATNKFKSNIKDMLNSGQIDITTLQKDFAQATELIQANFEGSSEGIKQSAENMFSAIKDSGNIDEMAVNITNVLNSLNETTVDQFKTMGESWKRIFLGINMDSVSNVEDLREQIKGRISALAKENPKFIEQMQTEMKEYFSGMVEDGKVTGDQLAQVMAENGYESVEEFNKAIEEGKVSTEEIMTQLGTDLGTNASEGFKGGLQDLPQGLLDQLNQAGVIIDENGAVIREDMSKQAIDAVNAFVESMNTQLPQLDGVTQDIQTRLGGIDNVRLGNVTKQLSEVNRWLGVVQQTAGVTYGAMSLLTSLKWGNTTKGLSEVNTWLMRTTNRATNTHTIMVGLTNLKLGNTTKGLSEINNWLMRTTNRSKDSRSALETLTTVPFGKTTKALSEVNNWLKDKVAVSAVTAHGKLLTLSKFTFSGVVSGLKSVNTWLNTVKNTAGTTRTAILSVANATKASVGIEGNTPIPDFGFSTETYSLKGLARDKIQDVSIANYKTSGGFYQPQALGTATAQLGTASVNNDALLRATLEQNQLLLQLLTQQKPVEVAVNMDGRQVAKASAKYMENEINLINARKNRLGGK